jgi:hypothetical protein
MDQYLRELLDAPIDNAARADKVWLPRGKRAAARGVKPQYHGEELPKIKPKEVRERAQLAIDTKKAQLLAYYATTDTPEERVAEHLKLPLDQVSRRLRELRTLQS